MKTGRLSVLLATTAFFAVQTGTAQQVDIEALQRLVGTEQSPLLIPLTYSSWNASDLADSSGQRVQMLGVDIFGIELDEVSFSVRALDDVRIQLADFNFPEDVQLGDPDDGLGIDWENLILSSTYNMVDQAPEAINFSIQNISFDVRNEGAENFSADFPVHQGASFNMVFDAAANTLRTDFQLAPWAGSISERDEEFIFELPGINGTYEASGYQAGQNPLSQFGPQISMMGGLIDGNFSGSVPEPIYAEQFTLNIEQTPFSIFMPSEDFDLRVSGGQVTGTGLNLLDPKASKMNLDARLEGIEFTGGFEVGQVNLGAISLSYLLEKMDVVRLAEVFNATDYEDLLGMSGAASGNLDDIGLSAVVNLYANLLENIDALGNISYTIAASDFSLENIMIGGTAGWDNLSLTYGISSNKKTASTGFEMAYAGIQVPEALIEPALVDLIPSDGSIKLALSNLDLPSLGQSLRQVADQDLRPWQVEDAIGAAVIGWWQGTESLLLPSFKLSSNLTTLSGDGEFAFNPFSAYGVTGLLDVALTNYTGLQQGVAEASASASPQMQQMLQGMTLGLGFLGGFGDLDDQDVLSLDVQLDEAGSVSVNGLPLPF